ncbi:hypothetical protein HYDPIDRAFT_103308 [Hydnomerulius pinastri MD-312]|uniref:Uncharacterized protein n=1 Tax=Hydnomerulius pinastri MD-312 TaxID=994086 RepID=A0A0C9UYG3_9AGAM|nr:hypothetical protein HYDPIDRAFT_103308 [Hydnomerulius pinastri MD-312]
MSSTYYEFNCEGEHYATSDLVCHLISYKIIISFFFKQYKKKKQPKVQNGSKRKNGVTHTPAIELVEVDVATDGPESTEDAELASLLEEDESQLEDTCGQAAHDTEVTNTTRAKAIREMREKRVIITDEQNKEALGIFPKVAGLVKKVHNSTTLGKQFARLRAANAHHLDGDKETLDRRVPTRSDLACLDAHLYFEKVIKQLTVAAELKSFRLTDGQWPLAGTLADILSLLSDPTKLFSRAEVPLIPNSVPMLTRLEGGLRSVSNDAELPPVIHVAAYAGVLLSEKYYNVMDECEVYRIAIVMSPDKKLQWFTANGYSSAVVAQICALVVSRWQENYKPPPSSATATPSSLVTPRQSVSESTSLCQPGTNSTVQRISRWLPPSTVAPERPEDDISTYLDEPVVPLSHVNAAGGLLKFWEGMREKRSSVAQMALNYCSAPGM